MWLRDAAREDKLPTVDQLDDPKYFPYRWGQAFWAYVGGKWGDDIIGDMLRAAGQTGDTTAAIQRLLGVTTKELSEEWHAAIRRAYDPVIAASTPPSEAGRLTIKGAELGGDLNVGPHQTGRAGGLPSSRTQPFFDLCSSRLRPARSCGS